MKQISKNSCYFCGKQWKNWEELRSNFKWEIQKMNVAYYVCNAHADDDEGKSLFFQEDRTEKKDKFTFWELKTHSNRLANYLKSQSLKKGDRVVVCLPQRAETIISHIAIWRLGAVSLPLMVLFGPDALKYRLQHSGANIAIVEDVVLEKLRSIRGELEQLKQIIAVGNTCLEDGEVEFWSSINKMLLDFEPVELNSDDNMVLIYTGGTTGEPKG